VSLIHNIVPKKPSEPRIHFLSKPGQDQPNLSKPGQGITETPEQPYIVTTFLNKLSEQQGMMKNERENNSLRVDGGRMRDGDRHVHALAVDGVPERLQALR